MLLDCDLPTPDGAALPDWLQAGQPLPPLLLMASEHVVAAQAQRCSGLGAAGMLSKPVSPARLLERVAALLGGDPRDAGMAPPSEHTPLHARLAGMRVLLVEDNEINQEVAQYILLHSGARVAVAANGQLAVDLLAASPRDFDVVLMDLQMPVLNGYEATQAIRALGLSELPIIAMTANAMDDDRLRAISSGMNAHVAKPIDVDELIQTLTRLVPMLGATDRQTPASSEHAAVVEVPASVPGIDLDAALHRFGGDYGAFLALLKRFENSQGDAVEETRRLLAQGQEEQAGQLLHRLCGVAANLGASTVADLSARAGKAVKAGQGQAADSLLAKLEQAMAVVIEGTRTLPLPLSHTAAASSPVDLLAGLAELLDLILNNNLKAPAQFHLLRPALEQSDRETALALDYAIGTLHFSDAEKLVRDQLKREENT